MSKSALNSSAAQDSMSELRSAPSPRLFSRLVSLLGPRTVIALVAIVPSSIALATVELGVSVFLQLFLKSIGLLGADVRTPFGDLNPSAAMLALALGTLGLIKAVSQWITAQSGVFAWETMNARLRRLAVWEMLLRDTRGVVPASATTARVGDISVKASMFCYFGANLAGAGVQAVALIPIMLLTAGGETAIAMAGLSVVGVFVLRLNKTTRAVAAQIPGEIRVLTEGIVRVARNALLVRVLRTESIEHRRLSSSVDRYAKHLIRAGVLGNFAGVVPPFAGILLLLGIIEFSQRSLHTPGVTLLAFLYLFVRFVGAAGNAAALFSNCSANWPAFKDSLEYVSGFRRDEIEKAMRIEAEHVGRVVERPPTKGGEPPDIVFSDLTFKYPGATEEVLRGVSATIAAGSQFAVVGPSGCGKSTLLALILGLLKPERGHVEVGGRLPADFFGDAATRIGYVGAEPFLIAGTVRENLRYGLSVDAQDSDLLAALELARVREAIEALPGRLDYLIAEDGSGLSAGQKQRLCLARALLNQPHVLVLDEASANLDSETEGEIAESLKSLRQKCTIILVSHRKGLLKYADKVLTLGQVD